MDRERIHLEIASERGGIPPRHKLVRADKVVVADGVLSASEGERLARRWNAIEDAADKWGVEVMNDGPINGGDLVEWFRTWFEATTA